jgi:hypothetical protein
MQLLSTRWGRRLLTFEKTTKYDEAAAAVARVALNKLREESGGVEDLLERMRATVYHGRETECDPGIMLPPAPAPASLPAYSKSGQVSDR